MWSLALQVLQGNADINYMGYDYQRMHADERVRHHDELRDEGYEWCPECGEVLIWDLPARCKEPRSAGDAPVVTGDCPPLTADQLLATPNRA